MHVAMHCKARVAGEQRLGTCSVEQGGRVSIAPDRTARWRGMPIVSRGGLVALAARAMRQGLAYRLARLSGSTARYGYT